MNTTTCMTQEKPRNNLNQALITRLVLTGFTRTARCAAPRGIHEQRIAPNSPRLKYEAALQSREHPLPAVIFSPLRSGKSNLLALINTLLQQSTLTNSVVPFTVTTTQMHASATVRDIYATATFVLVYCNVYLPKYCIFKINTLIIFSL
mgnify:CR=1 FL=1